MGSHSWIVQTQYRLEKQCRWLDEPQHCLVKKYLRPGIESKMKAMIRKANNNIKLQRILRQSQKNHRKSNNTKNQEAVWWSRVSNLVVVFDMNNIIYVRILLYLPKRFTNWHSWNNNTIVRQTDRRLNSVLMIHVIKEYLKKNGTQSPIANRLSSSKSDNDDRL